jgi:multidrug resistance efflux pump
MGIARFASQLTARLKKRMARAPMLLLWLIALGVVIKMSNGRLINSTVARGYAELIDISVASLETGKLEKLNATLGQNVKTGDVLAQLSTSYLDAELDQLKLDLEQKKAAVLSQRDVLESEVARGGIWVMKARASAQQDRAELDELTRKVERLQNLVNNQLVSRTEYEDALRQKMAVQARVATFNNANKKGSGSNPRGLLSGASHSFLESIELRSQPFELAVQEAEAGIKRLELKRQAMQLRAPCDGQVAFIAHRAGEVISLGTEIVRIVQAPKNRVVAFLPERLLAEASVGQAVWLEKPSRLQSKVTGVIVELGSEIELLPQRLWLSPQVPAFGRKFVVAVDGDPQLFAGEAFDVHL